MGDYTRSRVLSLRMDAALLEAVRESARRDGRSVSGQIVFYVRDRVEPAVAGPKPLRRISGWLSDRGDAGSLSQFQSGRAEASAKLRAAVRRKARRS
ncbi:MAG: hypothetical protein IT377_00535 [Polyangiaceae bacterium]|nr:hypothetical protein [Polyangiaceae bacterium]